MTNSRALIDNDGPVSLADVITTAASLGVTGLPPASAVDTGRVWPAGDEWVAEIGEPPNTQALDHLLATKEGAHEALIQAIERARDLLAERLLTAGGAAAQLAATRSRWAPPTLYTWDSADQREPQSHVAG